MDDLDKSILTVILLPIIIFSILFLPFITSIPYLDGNIDFVKSYDFYEGGIQQYFHNWGSVHPPFKLLLPVFLFRLFGVNIILFNIIGFVFGVLGIIFMYKLCQNIFNEKTALLSSLLLAVSPIFLASGIFSLIDFLISVLIIISLYFYSYKNNLMYGLISTLAVLTKETALLLPIVVILVESFILITQKLKVSKKDFKNLKNIFLKFAYISIPFLAYLSWYFFIRLAGQTTWNDWNFSSTSDRGSFYTIFNNLISFNFLNNYAYDNWKQLFVLNFNWFFWIIFLIGVIFVPKDLLIIKKNLIKNIQITKTIFVMIIFSILYFLAVLSFQTFTIPRYGLPILCFLIIGVSWTTVNILNKKNTLIKITFLFFFISIILLRLFYSIDPVSIKLWGTTNILGQTFFLRMAVLRATTGLLTICNMFFWSNFDQIKFLKRAII